MAVEKVPVTILQEMLVKLGTIPVYELCPSELKTLLPVFTYKVMCDDLIAYGSGKSKRDAKQNAAQSMIEKLNERQIVIDSSTTMPNNQDRSVQELMNLCNKLCLEDPIYKELETTGPPHAPIYTTQCKVSTFEQNGTARTKKLSKTAAAKKMIDQLKDTFKVTDSPNVISNKRIKRTDGSTVNGKTNANLSEISKVHEASKLKINYQLKMQSERKELLKTLGDHSSTLLHDLEKLNIFITECRLQCDNKKIGQLKQVFQNAMDAAKIDFHHMLLQTAEPVTFMLIIQLNIVPDVIEMSIGKTREEAEWRTINKITTTLKQLLM